MSSSVLSRCSEPHREQASLPSACGLVVGPNCTAPLPPGSLTIGGTHRGTKSLAEELSALALQVEQKLARQQRDRAQQVVEWFTPQCLAAAQNGHREFVADFDLRGSFLDRALIAPLACAFYGMLLSVFTLASYRQETGSVAFPGLFHCYWWLHCTMWVAWWCLAAYAIRCMWLFNAARRDTLGHDDEMVGSLVREQLGGDDAKVDVRWRHGRPMAFRVSMRWSTTQPKPRVGNIRRPCSICAEDRESAACVPCGHVLCVSCASLANRKGACFTCRRPVTSIVHLYE